MKSSTYTITFTHMVITDNVNTTTMDFNSRIRISIPNTSTILAPANIRDS